MAKVLLVEDDNNLREIFEMRLQAEGYSTVTASDGEQALVVATKEKPDLIIADVMMPKLSGFEMLETLHATPSMANTKVIMMTALGQAEDRARGEKLGVVKYLVKSQVTLEDFVRVVREVLQPNKKAGSNMDSNSTNPTDNNLTPPGSPADPPSTSSDSPAPDSGSGDTPPLSSDEGSNPISEPSTTPDTSGQLSTNQEQQAVEGQVNSFAGSTSDSSSSDLGGEPTSASGGSGEQPDISVTTPPSEAPSDQDSPDQGATPPSQDWPPAAPSEPPQNNPDSGSATL